MNLYKTNMNLSRSHFFKQKKISQSREMASGCDFWEPRTLDQGDLFFSTITWISLLKSGAFV